MVFRGFILFISALLSYCHSTQQTEVNVPFQTDFAKEMYSDGSIFQVDTFVDGDTFWVLNKDRQRLKVRLIGLDAPEVKTVFNKKKHPFGIVSKTYLDSLLTKNPYIKLTFDVDSLDQYGRTLAYAHFNDGTFLNEHLIKNGYATVMTISPNIKYEDLFYEGQQYARENKLGIWKEDY